jgi:hypothetical protein
MVNMFRYTTETKQSHLEHGFSEFTMLLHKFSYNITLHSLDPELVKMTVGCGICHINRNMYVQYTEVLTQENT